MRTVTRFFSILAGVLMLATSVFAGFAGTEEYLAAVGNPEGAGGAHFFTTVWITDVSPSPVTFTFQFLRSGQANDVSPTSFEDTLQPGQTKVYEDVAGNNLGLVNVNGAARITADGELFVSERIFNQPSGTPLSATAGQFFSGIPKTFSIGLGQSASLQGVYVGSGKDFRYNYVLLETAGVGCTVHVQLLDDSGTQLGAGDFSLLPYEHMLLSASALAPSADSENARLVATVTSGSGSALIAGSQVGNSSPQDQSGFEMSFPDSILSSGGGGAGVTSLNNLTGALNLISGNGISITASGSSIQIAATGSGSGGGFSLPYSNGASNPTGSVFSITNSATPPPGSYNSAIIAIDSSPSGFFGKGLAQVNAAVVGDSGNGAGVLGLGSLDGVVGVGQVAGIAGYGVPPSAASTLPTFGVGGISFGKQGAGVVGSFGFGGPDISNFSAGVEGTANDQWGVFGYSSTSDGVVGFSDAISEPFAGVVGYNSVGANTGYLGGSDFAVKGTSPQSYAIVGQAHAGALGGVRGDNSNTSGWGVEGNNNATKSQGFLGGYEYGVLGVAPTSGSATHYYAGYFSGDVSITGHLSANGAQLASFPHATDAAQEIRFASPAGPEAGTYFRGSGKIVNGFAAIEVPESFRMVTSEKGLTVQVTPMGAPAVIYCVKKGLQRIVIQGNSDVDFDYMVNGIRKGSEDFSPSAANVDFVPRSANDSEFLRHLDSKLIATLKANGILNEDGSINLETAHRLGWDRKPGWNDPKPESNAKIQ